MIAILLLFATGGLMQAARDFIRVPTSATVQLSFGFLLLAAFLTARVLSQLGLPKLTGYIIAGLLAGPFVFDLVSADMAVSLKIVSGTATAVIALEAGVELELAKVRRLARTLRAITIFAVIGSMFVIAGVIFLLQPMLPFLHGLETSHVAVISLVLGVSLSAQSPAVVMALLAETRAAGPLSEMVLAAVVISDLVVIVVFSIASAVASAVIGGDLNLLTTIRDVSWELFGSMAFGVMIGLLLSLYLRTIKDSAPLFALTICVVVAEAGPRVHLDPLIVMLAAGLLVRNSRRTDPTPLVSGFENAQLPVFLVFFALAGVMLDLEILSNAIVPVGIIVIVRALAFFVGARVATSMTAASPPVRSYAWVGLVPQAGLALAIALVLEKTFPTFGRPAAVMMIGVVGVNQLIGPIVLRWVLVRSGEAGQKTGPGGH